MTSKYFKIQELVSEEIYNKRGEKAWELINPKIIKTIDTIKERFPKGTCTVNNWLWNGTRNESGLRTSESKYYSPTSQHSLGNAIDFVMSAYTTEEVRQDVINNPSIYPYVRGIEMGVSWCHLDVRNRDTILLFYP